MIFWKHGIYFAIWPTVLSCLVTKPAFTRQTQCWSTRVGKLKLVCVNNTTTCWQTVGEKLARIETSSICRQQFANMLLCRPHTPN